MDDKEWNHLLSEFNRRVYELERFFRTASEVLAKYRQGYGPPYPRSEEPSTTQDWEE